MIAIRTNRIRRTARFLLACGALVTFLAPLGAAQQPQAIGVSFRFGGLAVPIPAPQREALEKRLSETVAQVLNKRYPYWRLSTTDPAPTQLQISLFKDSGRVMMRTIFVDESGSEQKHWEGILFDAGVLDNRPLPTQQQWPDELQDAFDERLVQANLQSILEVLKQYVPLGKEVSLLQAASGSRTKPTAVLALDFDKYQSISESEFLVRSDWPSKGKVLIQSTGLGDPAPYSSAQPPFQGIAIQLERWQLGGTTDEIENHLQSLGELRFLEFYLGTIRPHGLAH